MKAHFATICLAISLLGCKKDDDSKSVPAPVPAQLEGTWTAVEHHAHRVDASGAVTFDRIDPQTGTATFTDSAITWTEGDGSQSAATYTRNGSDLTVTSTFNSGGTVTFSLTIQELTASSLVIRLTGHDVVTSGDTETNDTKYRR